MHDHINSNSVFEDIALSEDKFTDQGFSEEGRESSLAATEAEKSGQRLSPTKDFWRVQQPENKKEKIVCERYPHSTL